MAYIFLDESGDLGFKKSSSRWFVFAAAIVPDFHTLEKIAKKVWKSLKHKYKLAGELHAYSENDITRLRVMKSLGNVPELKIAYIALEKNKKPSLKQKDKNLLYQELAHKLIGHLITESLIPTNEYAHIVFDRIGMKEKLRENFITGIDKLFGKRSSKSFEIKFEPSHHSKSIQMVDFIAWSIFRKYESDDDSFYSQIAKCISFEKTD